MVFRIIIKHMFEYDVHTTSILRSWYLK